MRSLFGESLCCPQCSHELNWYAYSTDNFTHYYCEDCDDFFSRKDSTSELLLDHSCKRMRDQYGPNYNPGYVGQRTSEYNKPKWKKTLNNILKR